MGRAFDRQIDRMERRAAGFKGITAGVLGADIIREGLRKATGEVVSFINEGARIESAIVDFTRLAGSVEQGKKTIQDLRELGPVTPFEFKDLLPVSQMIITMGAATADTLIPTLRMLGDTAGGSAERLRRIAFAFGEVVSNGRATAQELRQFTNAMVPLTKTAAEMFREPGESSEEAMIRIRKMTKDGKFSAEIMRDAFKIMTSEGGIFFKGMEESSKTFEGRLSTLREDIDKTKGTIGFKLLPTLKKYVNQTIVIAKEIAAWAKANEGLIKEEVVKWLDSTKQILKDTAPILKTTLGIISDLLPVVRELSPLLPFLAAGWLANTVTLLLLKAVGAVSLIAGITKAVWAAAFGQMAWNAAILLIPGGIATMVAFVIGGLALIGGAIFLLAKNWDTVKDLLIKGVKKFFSIWMRGLFLLPRLIVNTIGFIGKKLGEFFGSEVMEREFGKLINTMEGFDDRLAAIGEDAPKNFELIENSVQRLRTKFGGPIPVQKPAFVDPGSPEFLRRAIFDFGPAQERQFQAIRKREASLRTGIGTPFSVTNISNIVQDAVVRLKERKETETPFAVPDSVKTLIEDKKVIEHVVKLIVPGQGQDQTINLTPGSEAPPVEINMLGAN
jgi:tape measure domain-containing protein